MSNNINNGDRILFENISNGDEIAFSALYRNYVPRLFTFIKRIVRSDIVTEEIIQLVFLNLWISRDKLAEINNPEGWIFKVTSNICYSHLKRIITERRAFDELEQQCEKIFKEDSKPEEAKELSVLIHKAINLLPSQRKRIYRLSREEGLSHKEIALQLNISMNTVKNTMIQSLQFIRKFLEEHGYNIPTVIILLIFFRD